MSDPLAEFLGHTPDELLGRSALDFVVMPDDFVPQEAVRGSLGDGRFEGVCRLRRHDGALVECAYTTHAIYGAIRGLVWHTDYVPIIGHVHRSKAARQRFGRLLTQISASVAGIEMSSSASRSAASASTPRLRAGQAPAGSLRNR